MLVLAEGKPDCFGQQKFIYSKFEVKVLTGEVHPIDSQGVSFLASSSFLPRALTVPGYHSHFVSCLYPHGPWCSLSPSPFLLKLLISLDEEKP